MGNDHRLLFKNSMKPSPSKPLPLTASDGALSAARYGAETDASGLSLVNSASSASLSVNKGRSVSKSASENGFLLGVGHGKTQQESLLDQELFALEQDQGKRHARELSAVFLQYAQRLEGLQAKNRQLEAELAFDDHAVRDDPFYNNQVAEKLSTLYMQGNNVMVRLEIERKELGRLEALIQRSNAALEHQAAKLYELSALDHNHTVLVHKIRQMQHEMDHRVVKMNQHLHGNRKLRERIDTHHAERARMDAMFSRIALEALDMRAQCTQATEEVARLRLEVDQCEQQIEDVRQGGENWEQQCDGQAAVLLRELKEIALRERDTEQLVDVEKYAYLGENELMKHMNAAQENMLRARMSRSRWKTGQAKIATDVLLTKYQEDRAFIEKIHAVSGTKTVAEMIEAFKNQEVQHFERIQQVNQLADEIEIHRHVIGKLREDIGRLKQRKDSVDFQRVKRVENLKSRLQSAIDQKKRKEEANLDLQSFLASLKPAITSLHARIGCANSHSDGDMKKVLGDIEDQIVTVLQSYSAKTESRRKKEASSAASASSSSSGSTSAGTSSSTRSNPSSSASPNRKTSGLTAPFRSPVHLLGRQQQTSSSSSPPQESKTKSPPSTPAAAQSPDKDNMRVPIASEGGVEKIATLSAALRPKSMEQHYHYGGLQPPHLSIEQLRKKDHVEEEYPLTYDELKEKVWHGENAFEPSPQQ